MSRARTGTKSKRVAKLDRALPIVKQPKIFIEFQGKTESLEYWANVIGIHKKTLQKRLEKWPKEKALTEPPYESQRRTKSDKNS